AEMMTDPDNGEPFTAHTTNRVPFALIMEDFKRGLRSDGRLADVAPTILHLMNIKKPDEMDGTNLII
ncbi:MAG: 2,3-bisphosphoglycerate-independent phosphoglycerate mutase, partial [Candidatus Zixiibacteriota bacterium]